MIAPFWSVLGLEPTRDETTIRRSYAARLRATNPEDDPEGFKALREAYETALQVARHGSWDDEEAEAHDDEAPTESAASVEIEWPQTAAQPAEPQPAPDLEQADHEILRAALVDALRRNANPGDLIGALQAILRSPTMDRLDLYADTEEWLVWLIHQAQPQSHVLIDEVIRHFRLDGTPDAHGNRHPLVNLRWRVEEQARADAFIKRVRQPKHEFHQAWRETGRPLKGRGPLWGFRRPGRMQDVAEFLADIQNRVPLAAEQLDAEAVAFWRQRIAKARQRSATFGKWSWAYSIVFGLVLLGIGNTFGSHGNSTSRLRLPHRELLPSSQQNSKADPPDVVRIMPKPERVRTRDNCLDVAESPPKAEETDAVAAGFKACARAQELMPESLMVKQATGILALRSGDASAAYAEFAAILKISPDDPYAAFGLGLAAMKGADDAKADDGELVAWALKAEPAVQVYFAKRGVKASADVQPAEAAPSRIVKPAVPDHDARARDKSGNVGQKQFDQVYEYLGLETTKVGKATVRCLVRLNKQLSDCQVLEEAPRNLALAEIALKLAQNLRYEPATLKGEPVDGVPLVVPVEILDRPPPPKTPPSPTPTSSPTPQVSPSPNGDAPH